MPRRLLVGLVAGALMLALFPGSSPPPARAQTTPNEQELHQARKELKRTRRQIREQNERLRELQKDMDRLATRISRNRSALDRAKARAETLKREIAKVQARLHDLEQQLDARAREAYINGPGTPLLYLLTASSAADAASRIVMLNEMSRRDALLAEEVEVTRADLKYRQDSLGRNRFARRMLALALTSDRKDLAEKMARARALWHELTARREAIRAEISRLHPLAVCPVDGPVAIADDFGIWVHHPKNEGGDHIHQGNDMMAAMGTPIVAPFDGTAVAATNHIGGLAVKVYGEFGYVYNAHLSRFGQLGAVTTGTVVGYVGATGNAGGPHDHFEWHPGDGPAVDPHPFLMQVC